MGQRHQLFVVAKVGGQYWSLAAVHHQWLYGLSALKQCTVLLRIFSTPANWPILKQELAFAAEYFRDQVPPQERQNLSWDENEAPKFPFIMTCLMIGAGYNPDDSTASAVHSEPFGLDFDQGDNNDGITVLDITDLTNIKYCFVIFHESYYSDEDELEDENKPLSFKPLTGWEYLLSYYTREKKIVQDNIQIPDLLDTKSLIDCSTLAATWPWGQWKLGEDHPATGSQSPSNTNKHLSLVEQSIAKVVDTVLSSDDFDYGILDDSVQSIPNFHTVLRQCLIRREIGRIASSPASAPLLKLAYTGQDQLDWAVFNNISVDCVKEAIASSELSKAAVINISGTPAAQPGLGEALSLHDNLECVYALHEPTQECEDHSIKLYSDLATTGSIPNLNKLVISAPFSMAIRQSPWLPSTVPTLSAFPVTQLLTYSTIMSEHEGFSPMEYYFLGDALLSPVRVVTGLFRYLEALNGPAYMRWQGTGLHASNCFATASSSLGTSQDIEIGPFPADTYKYAKLAYHSGLTRGCYPKMRDLVPGQWTIMIYPGTDFEKAAKLKHEASPITHLDLGFHYAFVRSKSRIEAVEPTSEHDEKLAELEVADMEEFLRQTAPEIDTSRLQDHKDALVRRTYGYDLCDEQVARLRPGILKFLDAGEARELLKKFMINRAKIEKSPDNRYV